jgi:predicted AAA+ superfamily ATPase
VNNVKVGDKIPLKAYSNPSSFKLYFVDIGLFRYLADIPIEVIQNKDAIFDEFNGLLTEQFVLQQLANYNLFYWTGYEESEVDFIMQYGVDCFETDNHFTNSTSVSSSMENCCFTES